jgi:acetyl esterase
VIAFSRYAFRTGVAAALLAAVLAAATSYASAASDPVQVHQNVVYGQSAQGYRLTADVYSPTARTEPAPVVIVVHGGGFNSGDKKGTAQYASALASVGFVTVNVDYTLDTPGNPGYPEQVQEVQRAIQWSIAHARQYGGNPHRLALLGFSAGGYLSAMAALLDSGLPGRPIKAAVTLSAPLDLPALQQLLSARLAACGHQPSCPQVPQAPQLSAFGTLFEFVGCSFGNCSPQLLRKASPSNHVSRKAPAFLIFNSANELMPRSQAIDMGDALRVAQVPHEVVIVQGSTHGAGYAPDVGGTIVKFLGQQLGIAGLRLAASDGPARSSGAQTVLVVICAVVAAGSLGAVLLAMRRRTAGHR